MSSLHKKILAAIGLIAMLTGAILPAAGVDARIVAELLTIATAVAALLAAYWHEAPELPIPEEWTEPLAKIGSIAGGLATLTPIVLRVAGFKPDLTVMIGSILVAAAGVFAAYVKKSPDQKQLASLATIRPPIAMMLAFLVCCSCAGIQTHPRTPEEQCSSLEAQYEVWGALAIAASGTGVGGGAAAYGFNETTEREVSAAIAIGSAIVFPVAVFLRDQVTRQYGELCERRPTSIAVASSTAGVSR